MGNSAHGPRLTDWDRSLLARHLPFYESLASGTRKPTTLAQEHFIAVLEGRATPRTQHEIAYTRYRQSPDTASLLCQSSLTATNIATTQPQALEDALDAIEKIELTYDGSGRFSNLFQKVKRGYVSGKASLRDRTSQAALWLSALTAESEWSQQVERWSAEQFNNLSNVYSQAMDHDFIVNGVGNGWTHRILDGGHTLSGSWEAARNALRDDTFWQEMKGWGEAFGSDLSSVVGMPITTLSSQSLDYLQRVMAPLGVSQSDLVDILSVNAVEAAAALVPMLGAIMNWTEPEREEFAKMIGASGVAAVISANPLLFLVSVVCTAKAFHEQRHSKAGLIELTRSVASGGALSGVVLTTSSLVAGPVWVGVVSGILLVLLMKRAGEPVDLDRFLAGVRGMLVAETRTSLNVTSD